MDGTVFTHGRAEIVEMTPNAPRILEAILAIVGDSARENRLLTQYDIVKTLFLADRAHLNKLGRPITYDNYVAMKHGPVPSLAYDFLKEEPCSMTKYGISEFPWTRTQVQEAGTRCYNYTTPQRLWNNDVLSESDSEELHSALVVVKSLDFRQIRRLTHQDQAYIDAWVDESDEKSFPMSYSLLFDNPNRLLAKELSFYSTLA